jgi:hypothetical protein
MDRLLARLLLWAVAFLPADRRAWGEAVWAEAEEVPAGRARARWLAGGVWMIVREVGMFRRIGYTATGLAIGAITVRLGWHPGSANPAVPADRITMIISVLVLAAMPWITRRRLGPVAAARGARTVRAAGFTAMYALLLVMTGMSRFAGSRFDHFQAFDQSNWEADMLSGAIVSAVIVIALITGYAFAILAITARWTSATAPVLAIGAAIAVAVYALMPLGTMREFGNGLLTAVGAIAAITVPVAGLLAVGVLAGRHVATGSPDARLRVGTTSGLYAGAVAALLLNILTVTTMLLLPRQVDLKWANPDPAVPHGTAFEIQMSVSDAALPYQIGLVLGPLAGLVLGAIGGNSLIRAGGPAVGRGDEAEPVPPP